ncbi:hypothetical protein D4R42_04490 [bacterium]|nr:MAG: hypothetical protein D4R42_04490 [bacterium]
MMPEEGIYKVYEGLDVVDETDTLDHAIAICKDRHLMYPHLYHEVFLHYEGSTAAFGKYQLKPRDDIQGFPRGEYPYDWVLFIDWNNGRQGMTLILDTPRAKRMFDDVEHILQASPYNIDVFLCRVAVHKTILPGEG